MFLNAREELHARDAMSAFVDVTKRSPGLVRPHATTVVPAMLSVAAAQALDSATRAMAVEVVLGAAEGSPGAFRRSPALTQAVVERCVALVAEVEDDPEWAAQSYDEEEDVDQQDATVVGADGLLRFADYVGAKSVLPPTFALVPGLARSARWQERYAAASAVAMVADSSAKLMSTELAKVVELVMPLLQVRAPRACCRPRLCSPNVLLHAAASLRRPALRRAGRAPARAVRRRGRAEHHGGLLLGRAAEQAPCASGARAGHAGVGRRRQLPPCAWACHVRAGELCQPRALPQVGAEAAPGAAADGAAVCAAVGVRAAPRGGRARVGSLTLAGHCRQADLQRVALNAVANVARVVEDAFSPYYDRFMPGVKSILRGATAVELRDLRGSAFECVGAREPLPTLRCLHRG